MADLLARFEARTRHRRKDRDTSVSAAYAIVSGLRELQWVVLRYAIACGARGFVDVDMTEAIGDATQSTFRTRRSELTAMGYIEDSGQRRKLLTGRRAIVWRVTDKGREQDAAR